ncbi:MAG: restriction endonuclease subunit S, partial [Prevotella sp.]|nr:restriction endonuclease subunit S [Prevotella sp.]
KFAKGGGQPLLTATQIKDFVIPVPSMQEQQRIVSILDRFEALTTDLQSGLPAEIEARRQQYEYYRNKLLTFEAV